MFSQVINCTPLTSPAANLYFTNITGDTFNYDESFVATLRALLAPRIGQNEFLQLKFNSSNYYASDIDNSRISSIMRTALRCPRSGEIIIHNFNSTSSEHNDAWMRFVTEHFASVFEGFTILDKVTEFFKKKFSVVCFINPNTKSVAIFINKMDMRKMHHLQCGILAFMPWYFDPANGVSELEMELIESLRSNSSQRYEDCIARIAEQYDFRTTAIKKMLSGFETKYERIECDKVRRAIDQYDSKIDTLNRQIGECLILRRDSEIKLLGLETKIAQDSGESEIMDYFLCNPRLVLEDVSDTTMLFCVRDYLTYYDEDMAARVINNMTSYIYRPNGRACNNYIPADDMKLLMTEIFINQRLKIRFCAAYEFVLEGNVTGIQHHSFSSEFRDYTPNPHIDRYRCLGNYERNINTLLKDHNYIGALEQCIASCKSLNFGDSTVMQEFMRRIYGLGDNDRVNIRCIELPDGSVVEPKQAIEFLKQEVAEDGKNN